MSSKYQPLVSIVMPIYDTEEFLPDAVKSVLSQTYKNWELFLINDESPGNARLIASRFTDPRIRYLEHSNSGPSVTRNRGIKHSAGDLIAFLDSDDIWKQDKLEKQVALFEKSSDVGVVYSHLETINCEGMVVPGSHPKLHRGMVLDRLWSDNFICLSSAVIRRDVFDSIGYFDESLKMSEDFDFWLRVACNIRFDYIDEPLVQYRVHNNQVSKKTDIRVEICRGIRERFETKYGRKLSNKARRIANAYLISNIATRNFGKVSVTESLADYIRSIVWYPFQLSSWFGIAKIVAPRCVYDFMRNIIKSDKGYS